MSRARVDVKLVPSFGKQWRAEVTVLVAATAEEPGIGYTCNATHVDSRVALGGALQRIGEQLQKSPLPRSA